MTLICAVNPGGRHVQWLRTQSVSKEFVLEANRVIREPGVVQKAACASLWRSPFGEHVLESKLPA